MPAGELGDNENSPAREATRPNSLVAAPQEERLHFDQADMKDFGKLVEFFSTKQEELDQFKQNDEKQYDDDSDNWSACDHRIIYFDELITIIISMEL